jgi:hypothetical protein
MSRRQLATLFMLLPLAAIQSGASMAASLPNKIGQCSDTVITSITDRFGEKLSALPPRDGFDPGIVIEFGNGGRQFSYEKKTATLHSQIGDKVRMCLAMIPKNCPPGDKRGRVYKTRNLRTGEKWSLPDSLHLCGGA